MKIRATLGIAAALFMSATAAWSEISADQVAGKTMIGENKAKFVIGADGSLSGTTGKGEALTGSWTVKKGNWCRTIKEPKKLAGQACQAATINGNTLTLTNKDGSSVSFKIK